MDYSARTGSAQLSSLNEFTKRCTLLSDFFLTQSVVQFHTTVDFIYARISAGSVFIEMNIVDLTELIGSGSH